MTNTTTLNSINKDFFSFKEDLDYLYYPNIISFVNSENYETNSFNINKLRDSDIETKFFCEFAIKTYSLQSYTTWDKLSLDEKTNILTEFKNKLSSDISFFDDDEINNNITANNINNLAVIQVYCDNPGQSFKIKGFYDNLDSLNNNTKYIIKEDLYNRCYLYKTNHTPDYLNKNNNIQMTTNEISSSHKNYDFYILKSKLSNKELSLHGNYYLIKDGLMVGPSTNLDGVDLSNRYLCKVDLTNTSLASTNLTDVNLEKSITGPFTGNPIISSNYKLISYPQVNDNNENIYHIIGPNINLNNANLSGLYLEGCNLNGITFDNAITGPFTGSVTLSSEYLHKVITNSNNKKYIIGPGVNMTNYDLDGCDLHKCTFTGAITGPFTGANITLPANYVIKTNGANENFILGKGVSLKGANLIGMSLSDLNESYFEDVITGPVNARSSTILPANYSIFTNLFYNESFILGPGVKLENAKLYGANLVDYNLTNVITGPLYTDSTTILGTNDSIKNNFILRENVKLEGWNSYNLNLQDLNLANINIDDMISGYVMSDLTDEGRSGFPAGYNLISENNQSNPKKLIVGINKKISFDTKRTNLNNFKFETILNNNNNNLLDCSNIDFHNIITGPIIFSSSQVKNQINNNFMPTNYKIVDDIDNNSYVIGPNVKLDGFKFNNKYDLKNDNGLNTGTGIILNNVVLDNIDFKNVGVPGPFKYVNTNLNINSNEYKISAFNSELNMITGPHINYSSVDLKDLELNDDCLYYANLEYAATGPLNANSVAYLNNNYTLAKNSTDASILGPKVLLCPDETNNTADLSNYSISNCSLEGLSLKYYETDNTSKLNLSNITLSNVVSCDINLNKESFILDDNTALIKDDEKYFIVKEGCVLKDNISLKDGILNNTNINRVDLSKVSSFANLSTSNLNGIPILPNKYIIIKKHIIGPNMNTTNITDLSNVDFTNVYLENLNLSNVSTFNNTVGRVNQISNDTILPNDFNVYFFEDTKKIIIKSKKDLVGIEFNYKPVNWNENSNITVDKENMTISTQSTGEIRKLLIYPDVNANLTLSDYSFNEITINFSDNIDKFYGNFFISDVKVVEINNDLTTSQTEEYNIICENGYVFGPGIKLKDIDLSTYNNINFNFNGMNLDNIKFPSTNTFKINKTAINSLKTDRFQIKQNELTNKNNEITTKQTEKEGRNLEKTQRTTVKTEKENELTLLNEQITSLNSILQAKQTEINQLQEYINNGDLDRSGTRNINDILKVINKAIKNT